MKGDETLLKWIASTLKRLSNRKHPHGTVAQTSQSRPAGTDQSPQAPQFLPDQVAETSQRVRVTKGRVRDVQSNAGSPPLGILKPFLNSRGIQIKVLRAEDASDKVIDRLSLYLGENYDALRDFHRQIKRAMREGKRVVETVKNRSQKDINTLREFCTILHEVAFLEKYRYVQAPEPQIHVKTTTFPKAQNFFSGQWLERFVLQKVMSVHALVKLEVTEKLAFEYLINPQIILPNGKDFELDILTAIGSSIYWIEAKSGDYQQYVHKYSKYTRLLGLDDQHAFMVLPDIPDDRCNALSSLFSMTVCNLRTFEEKLLSIVRNDTAQQSAAASKFPPIGETNG